MLKQIIVYSFVIFITACSNSKSFYLKLASPAQQMSGTDFYKTVAAWKWKERDSLAVKEILSGNIPSFFKNFIAVTSSIQDSSGKTHTAVFYVSPDYVSIGTNEDWARIPLTPMAAQKIADSFNCFLPTKKIVDLIYANAVVRLEPVPMYTYRDSSITMWQHHLIIEGQRKQQAGLIAGIKKDVVLSAKILADTRPNREAIYGWHQSNGKPIQPLYTGHISWWVDYSHGIRLVYREIKVDGKKMDYTAVLQHPVFKNLLCDEADCNFFKYPYQVTAF